MIMTAILNCSYALRPVSTPALLAVSLTMIRLRRYLELPDGRRLADYQSVPCSLVMYSAPTPPEGIWAEVLAVEDPNQVNPASVKGKLLLTDRTSRELIPLAMEGGAVGILSDFIPLSAARK